MRLDNVIGHVIGSVAAETAIALPTATDLHRQRRLNRNLLILLLLAGALIVLFLTIDVKGQWAFALPRRARKVAAIVIVGFAISYSTVLFQTVTNNKILTPSIIGFDSLYMLVQTIIVFVFGSMTLAVMDDNVHFFVNVGLMIFFALLLYQWLFGREGQNLYYLVLIGVIFGSFFGSTTTFLQRLIDPNDFTVLQDRMFASFNSVNQDLLWVTAVAVIATFVYTLRFTHALDVLSLGRDQAINLGLNHPALVRRIMIVVAILVSVSTALVGPITFFGLLVANLAYQFMATYRHRYLVPAAALISVIALVGGQLLVERVFTFSTSLSVIVNFIGGLYFIYLLLKETRA
jgi:iron complex transport system permease protein